MPFSAKARRRAGQWWAGLPSDALQPVIPTELVLEEAGAGIQARPSAQHLAARLRGHGTKGH